MDWNRLDTVRRSVGPLQRDTVEAYVGGKISRRAFLRKGAILGLSVPTMSMVLAACGDGDGDAATTTAGGEPSASTPATTAGAGQTGGVIRYAHQRPATTLDPVLMQSLGAYGVVSQSFEFLTTLGDDGDIAPGLATDWSPNDDGTVWTFNLRSEAKWMADGSPFTSSDVKATMNRLVESGNSGLDGVIGMDAVDDSDPAVAVFQLEAANGNLPYLVSMFNAQSCITPVSYEVGSALEVTPNGTGAWKLVDYDQATGATFERNPDWWGGMTPLDGVEFQFFDDIGTQVTAIQGGSVDAISQFSVIGGDALLNDPNFVVLAIQAATHRQVWMRTDTGQFADKRVRQALALTFNREQMVETLFRGRADIGNDHVIAPFLPYFDSSVPQRTRDIEQAKALLTEAGFPDGLQTTLHCAELQEIPQLAQLIQAGASEAGFDLQIEVEGLDTFYGNQWCPPGDDGQPTDPPCNRAAELGIVDYGHRPTPDIYLNAALSTNGVWNSSQYSNPDFDTAFTEYSSAVGVDEQKAAANKIETILNEDVPVGVPFFYNYLAGHSNRFQGVLQSALGHPVVSGASMV